MSVLITKEIETPLGVMKLGAYNGALVLALWLTGDLEKVKAIERRVAARCGAEAVEPGDCDLFLEAEVQIMEYLKGRRWSFDVPIRLFGTAFQKRVWRVLTDVNYGCVTTYGMLALMAGCSGGSRAVGAAAGANPLHVIIPCHRVVEKSGRLGGYAGGRQVKFELIAGEGRRIGDKAVPKAGLSERMADALPKDMF